MKNWYNNIIIIALVAILGGVLAGYALVSIGILPEGPAAEIPAEGTDQPNTDPGLPDLIRVTTPRSGETVTSPLTITGEARGTWYFEASFPVELLDANGNRIAIAPAQAQGEWMTEEFVPFKLALEFPKPSTPTGTLVLHRDNPSGLPEHDKEIRVPVRFE